MQVLKTFDSDECSLIDIKKDKFHSNSSSFLEPTNTSLKTSWNFLINPRSGFTTKLLEHYL